MSKKKYTLRDILIQAPLSKLSSGDLKSLPSGTIPGFTASKEIFYVNKEMIRGDYIFVNAGGAAGVKYHEGSACYSYRVIAYTTDLSLALPRYVYHYLDMIIEEIDKKCFTGSLMRSLNKRLFLDIEIPIPELKEQVEIIKILDRFAELV